MIIMKKLILTISIVIILTLSNGYSQTRSITFSEKPWAEIQAIARQENKLIFLDAYAVWCGPCKWMSANIFTNDTVADYYNRTFICAKMDMEKGEGIALAKKYEVRAYPTLLFINSDGDMVHKKVGAARKIKDYIDLGITAQDADNCFSAVIKKYQAGNNDPVFIFTYLRSLQDAYLPVSEPLKKYVSTQKSDDLIIRTNWNIIYNFSNDMASPEFIYLVKNQKEFERRYTTDSVLGKISDVYSSELNKVIRSKPFSASKWGDLLETIKQSGFSGSDKIILDAQLSLYYSRKDTVSFLNQAVRDVNPVYWNDYSRLNNIAWQVFSITGDRNILEKTAEWAKRSTELKNEPFNNDTYATILFRLGKKEEAIRAEKKAIESAHRMKLPSKKYEDALTRMESVK